MDIIAETLTDRARYQNESIQRGIDTQTDIKGAKFAKLKTDTTLRIRNKRGHGFTPLDTMKTGSKKKLRNTKMVPAKQSDLTSKVIMVNEHGIYHNQEGGFITGENSMIPNQKVPQREWFGITKEMKKGGKQYEKFVRMTLTKIVKSINK